MFVLVASVGLGSRARAEEKQPYLLLEPTEYTDVIDAFDNGDPFDINVNLTFERSSEVATVSREWAQLGDQAAGRFLPIARSEQVTNALVLAIELGLYKDLMVYGRLPLVLSDTRQLRLPSEATCDSESCMSRHANIQRALAVQPSQADSPPLFDLNMGYQSATRSGIPAVDVGVAWGIVNQYRTPYLPTWVVAVEARIGVGQVIKPCTDGHDCQTGINRGTLRLDFSSRWSQRYRYVEPYLGLRYVLEWATGARERFSPFGAVPGYLDTTPPSQLETTLGGMFIAWEERGRFQRFAIDVRAHAAYIAAGRDYTVLFDALGTSEHVLSEFQSATGKSPPFTGLTNVDGHARLALEIAAAIQAARYVRFRLGVSLARMTAHLLTAAAPCAAVSAETCPEGQVNPLYRPIVDLPGQRFRFSSDLTFNLFATATGQF